MKEKELLPGRRSGAVSVPSSKSQLIRLLILSALGEKETEIFCRGRCGDAEACISCLRALGAQITDETGVLRVRPVPVEAGTAACGAGTREKQPAELFCGESASVLRFLLPVSGALGRPAVFHMEGRLPERPLEPLAELLREHGMRIRRENALLYADGRLSAGNFRIPGNISSQFISGLLMALPLLPGESTLEVSGPMESADYIRMTVEALEAGGIRLLRTGFRSLPDGQTGFRMPGDHSVLSNCCRGLPDGRSGLRLPEGPAGVPDMPELQVPHMGMPVLQASPAETPEENGRSWRIPGNQKPCFSGVLTAEGDYSAAAFFFCMGALSEQGILVRGMSTDTLQGDRRILDILGEMGAEVNIRDGGILVRGRKLSGCWIDASGIPDLVPALAVTAAAAEGRTEIVRASRLRLKESDRLRSTAGLITALGGTAEEKEDGLIITGSSGLRGGTADPQGDHRIAMAAALAACISKAPVLVRSSGCVAKSFPGFWEEYGNLAVKGVPH